MESLKIYVQTFHVHNKQASAIYQTNFVQSALSHAWIVSLFNTQSPLLIGHFLGFRSPTSPAGRLLTKVLLKEDLFV